MTAELTPEQAELIALARSQAVEGMTPALRGVAAVVDGLHSAGFSIPQPVTDACQVLAAFGVALAHNAQGEPAPREAAELLGLRPPTAHVCPDCGGYGKHAPWCPE